MTKLRPVDYDDGNGDDGDDDEHECLVDGCALRYAGWMDGWMDEWMAC